MASLLQLDRVEYECACGQWAPLCRILYCRHCSVLKCHACCSNELDCTFCGTCLENVPAGEARVRRNRCNNCHQCPICGATLLALNKGEKFFLMCGSCKWTTYDSDINEHTTGGNWKMHEHPFEAELSSVLEQMKNFETNEKTQRDAVKRRSNIGVSRFSDRFGMQQMVDKRKAAMTKTVAVAPERPPLTELEELSDDQLFTERLISLDSHIRQINVLATERMLIGMRAADSHSARPVRMLLRGRKVFRCLTCDHTISKLEYSPSSIVYKIQNSGRMYLPEIRLSRECQVVADSKTAVFLSIVNDGMNRCQAILAAEDSADSVRCDAEAIDMHIPPNVESCDDEPIVVSASSGNIYYKKKNRVGVQLDVHVGSDITNPILRLLLKWKVENGQEGAELKWTTTRVKVLLTPRKCA